MTEEVAILVSGCIPPFFPCSVFQKKNLFTVVRPPSNIQQQLEQHFTAFRAENNHRIEQLDHHLGGDCT